MKLAFACLFMGSKGVSDSDWEAYKREFNKVYNGEENEEYRRSIFEQNLVDYADLNALEPLAHYGPTIFTDMKTQEYLNGYMPSIDTLPELEVEVVTIATQRDWTGKYTTSIKDAISNHTQYKITDFTFCTSSHGPDLDPETYVFVKRMMSLRRAVVKRP